MHWYLGHLQKLLKMMFYGNVEKWSAKLKQVKLANGEYIPAIFFGPDELGYTPHQLKRDFFHRAYRKLKRLTIDKYNYVNAVASAIECGFHTIDFSAAYGDGSLMAEAIRKSGVLRKDIIITTRVTNKAQFNGNIEEEFTNQLKGFGTDYIDILMFHWPVTGCYEKTWEEMLKIKEKGYCRILGVANCHEHHLKKIKEISGIYPQINQVEVHPLFTQEKLRKFCYENQIQVQAYSPTGRQDDRLMNPPLLNDLAQKYSKSKTQIILRWHIQNGMIPVIRTLNSTHQKTDIDIFDFKIDKEDMKKIDSMNINSRLRYDPDNCDFTTL